jgi:hypothetical protein
MSEFTPHFGPIVVLLFLGSILLTGISLLVLLYGAARRSSLLASIGAGAIACIVVGYGLLLCGVSLASSAIVLPPGGWKYFCEIDCHLAYSVTGSRTTAVIGPEMQQINARGQFIIVRVKTWFDEHTISPRRGDSPLTPNHRRVVLVDEAGRGFSASSEGEAALRRLGGTSTPISEPLRPGESYTTDFVFDVPRDAHGLRLLIIDDAPETRLLIGHENSFLHKKIYFGLDATPTTPNSATR